MINRSIARWAGWARRTELAKWVRNRRNTVPDAIVLLAILGGLAWWQASRYEDGMVDLAVYREAGRVALGFSSAPASLYAPEFGTGLPDFLPFTYPPFAALLFTPLAILPDIVGATLFTAVSVAVLVGCLRNTSAPMLRRVGVYAPVLAAALLGVALLVEPVTMTLGLGQINLVLMALCLADCVARQPRWPSGLLIGIATAVKLTPGIFIIYLWITGRRRAAATATGIAAACTGIGALLRPEDSLTFWTEAVFDAERLRDNSYYYNQSLRGVALRLLPDGVDSVVWLVLVALVAWVGLRRARAAHARGDEVAAVAMVGLVAVLVSPVAWIHHATWLVLALVVLVDAAVAEPARRASLIALAAVISAVFVARLPQVGHNMRWSDGPDPISLPLENLYAATLLALLLLIPARRRPQPAESDEALAGQGLSGLDPPSAPPHPPRHRLHDQREPEQQILHGGPRDTPVAQEGRVP
jgi:alpha-1,2-mannosyltransferase